MQKDMCLDQMWKVKLAEVTTIVCHRFGPERPCADGTAAAILLRDALPKAKIVFASHGPELDAIKPRPGFLFCDTAPPDSTAEAFLELGALVLDHHETRQALVERFAARGLGIFGQNAHMMSGANLAFCNVWAEVASNRDLGEVYMKARDFAQLAAIRDTWRKTHSLFERATQQAAVLSFFPFEHWPSTPFSYNADRFARMFEDLGPTLIAKRATEIAAHAKQAVELVTERGTRIAVVNTLDTSDVADLVKADVLVGFHYYADERGIARLRFSMRSRGTYDVGAVALRNGGGGHKPAAGFDVNPYDMPWASLPMGPRMPHDPYTLIRAYFDEYEARHCSDCAGTGIVEDDATGAIGYIVKKSCPRCRPST